MKSFEEFQQYLHENLGEELGELEGRRSNMKSRQAWLGGILAGIITLSWALTYLGMLPGFSIIVTCLISTPVVFFVYKKFYLDTEIPKDFKDLVVKNMVSFVDPSLEYDPAGYIPYEDFRNSKLFLLEPDNYTGDDLIHGTVDGVNVSFSELQVSYEEVITKKNKKKSKWGTIFHGLFMVAESPVEFNGETFILTNDLFKKLGYAATLVQKHNFLRGHYILPQNMKFRENFVVYADDLLEGELLLTENLMQKMVRLKKTTGASSAHISIIGNKIYVAVDMRKEIFKISLSKPLNKAKYIREFYNDLYFMLTIIDDLNFDAFLEQPSEGDGE